MLPHHRAGHDGSPAACYVNDAGRACVSLVHVSLESCCAPTDPIFFFRFTPLHIQVFFIFVTFFFLPFIPPSGSLQRGGMTCSHLHPLRPQPSSGPQGLPLFLHTPQHGFTFIHPPHPQPSLPPTHVTSSLPETHNYFLQTPVLTYDSIFNYKRAKQAGTGGGAAALL